MMGLACPLSELRAAHSEGWREVVIATFLGSNCSLDKGALSSLGQALGDLGTRHPPSDSSGLRDADTNQLSPISVEGADGPLPFALQRTDERSEHETIWEVLIEKLCIRPGSRRGKIGLRRKRCARHGVNGHCILTLGNFQSRSVQQ
jgi:hypothetical protein